MSLATFRALRSAGPSSCSRIGTRAFTQTARRNASNPSPDYNADPIEALHKVRRGLIYALLGTVGTVTAIAIGFEALHTYVETGPMGRSLPGQDEYGWEDEVQGWTGGVRGGTDPRLGWKARHALRAAWMCQTWGAADPALSSGQGIFEPDWRAVEGVVGLEKGGNRPDRGYEMADGFFNVALEGARGAGLVFPPTLSMLRTPGPPTKTQSPAGGGIQGDPAVVDILLLKAGGLERIGTQGALAQAKEIYEQIVETTRWDGSPIHEARMMRLAGKVGSLCARMGNGDEALAWWGWGLQRVGLEIPSRIQEIKTEAKGWFGKAPEPQQPQPALPTSLPPPVLRATISLLVSSATHLATQSHIPGAASLQTTALTILPAPAPIAAPDSTTAPAVLHHTWIEQRSSLLALHLASTSYALGRPALNLATVAASRSEDVLNALTPLPPAYTKSLAVISRQLQDDAILTAAEAAYTRGLLLERLPTPNLPVAAECYERAMSLHASDAGAGEATEVGREWQKYWDSLARVKQKLGQSS